jgi:hypothetical protein
VVDRQVHDQPQAAKPRLMTKFDEITESAKSRRDVIDTLCQSFEIADAVAIPVLVSCGVRL